MQTKTPNKEILRLLEHPVSRLVMTTIIVLALLVRCDYGLEHGQNAGGAEDITNETTAEQRETGGESPTAHTDENATTTDVSSNTSIFADPSEENVEPDPKTDPTPAVEEEEEEVTPTTTTTTAKPDYEDFTARDLRYEGSPVHITYHAKCRMNCRYIDAYEIQQVIDNNYINKRKSNPNASPGRCPTIAYEGRTKDDQLVRVILGDCANDPKIITVIDLENNYDCHCK